MFPFFRKRKIVSKLKVSDPAGEGVLPRGSGKTHENWDRHAAGWVPDALALRSGPAVCRGSDIGITIIIEAVIQKCKYFLHKFHKMGVLPNYYKKDG